MSDTEKPPARSLSRAQLITLFVAGTLVVSVALIQYEIYIHQRFAPAKAKILEDRLSRMSPANFAWLGMAQRRDRIRWGDRPPSIILKACGPPHYFTVLNYHNGWTAKGDLQVQTSKWAQLFGVCAHQSHLVGKTLNLTWYKNGQLVKPSNTPLAAKVAPPPSKPSKKAPSAKSEPIAIDTITLPAKALNSDGTKVAAAKAIAAPVPPTDPAQTNGRWFGYMEQGSQRYQMRLSLQGNTGHTDYPSLQCGGALDLLTVDTNQAVYSEKITNNRARCLDGVVTFTRLRDILHVAWVGYSGGQEIRAYARLERIK